jgi:hypothetical protein
MAKLRKALKQWMVPIILVYGFALVLRRQSLIRQYGSGAPFNIIASGLVYPCVLLIYHLVVTFP